MKKTLTALALAAACTMAAADTIGVHTVTWHSQREYVAQTIKIWGFLPVFQIKKEFRVFTPGIYYRTDAGLTLDLFTNSYGSPSFFAGWTVETDNRRWWLSAGGVWGYGPEPGKVRPMAIGGIAARLDKDFGLPFPDTTIRVGVIPGWKRPKVDPITEAVFGRPKRVHVVTVMVERKF